MTEVPPVPMPGVKDLFSLDPAVAHLNHGSYGAVPLPVQRAQARLRVEQEQDPDGFFGGLPDRIGGARARIATALGAHPDRLALLTNVTEGIAVVLDSVPLAEGDEILVTDHGYGAVVRAAERRAAETGAKVCTARIPLGTPDADGVAEHVLAAVGDRTRIAVLDLVTSPTAREIAGPRLLAALAERGIVTVVDAAHAPGQLPVDLGGAAGGADFWVGNLHKWAFTPRATAVLAARPPWLERIRPLVLSWEHDRGFPGHVEWRGTCDYTPWLAAPAGFALLQRLGAERVRAHNEVLAAYGSRLLAERAGLRELPVMPGLAMRAVRLPPGCAETEQGVRELMASVREHLDARVAVRPWPGGGVLRISAQVYNCAGEYRRLADGIGALLRT
ncbi:aminotransferase class V-fold PLP-dependent enzyme [Saccharothrix sp. ST-888]|uniref:aminotransferase class V-fold PLP-dependent enzyme n=1 Tax=Saccharothrix sp. ST-888 TaxID=1427391 RepID=UPI000A40E982|nr:aminotransferase class V-fold PLP-dependent enzyme [Saccharothrix sp. ST-888]